MKTSLRLKNVNIIHHNGKIEVAKDIAIDNGIIQSISATGTGEGIDCSGLYVTPGLVNLHAHSPMNIFKGIAEDVHIDDWFNKELFPYESKLTADEAYWGTMLAIAEMINNGVTSFADHYFFSQAIYAAVDKSGIRADIATTLFGMSPNFEEELASATAFIAHNKDNNSRIKLRFGPHAPYTCPPNTLTKIVASAKALDVGIHIHLSETKTQVDNSYNASHCSPFEFLNDCGGFEVPVIIGHGLWVEHTDLPLLQDKNVYFAVCPKTYMKLAMGSGRIWDIHHKINMSFGTDGAASSNSVSPIEQARLFALHGKMAGSAEDFRIEYLWQQLMKGHEALAFNTGKVEVGYDADLLVWDLNKVNTAPIYHPLTSIIYSSDASNIKHSLVQGQFVKYDGMVKLDLEEIICNVKSIQADILKRGKGEKKINY